MKIEIHRNDDPVIRWDIVINGHFWTSAFTRRGARRLVRRYWKEGLS